MPAYYEPPYTTLIESASINFAGMSYNDYSTRYANLETHVLEPPNFKPNSHSYIFSGSRNDDIGYSSVFLAGDGTTWQSIGQGYPEVGCDGASNTGCPMSVAAWIRVNYSGSAGATENNYGTIFQFVNRSRSASRRRLYLQGNASNPTHHSPIWLVDGALGDDGEVYGTQDAGAIKEGQWHHIIVTYDGTNPAGNSAATLAAMKIYVDGRAITTDVRGARNMDDGPAPIDGGLAIGNVGESYRSRPFNGNIDELQVFKAALTSDEARDLFQRRGVNMFGFAQTANMLSWYRFGNSAGDTVSVIKDVMGRADAIQIESTGNTQVNPDCFYCGPKVLLVVLGTRDQTVFSILLALSGVILLLHLIRQFLI